MLRLAMHARRELFIEQWKARQRELRARMIVAPLKPLPRFVAGADAAFSADKTQVFAAAVVYDRAEQRVIEVAHAVGECTVPYVPGFLTWRRVDWFVLGCFVLVGLALTLFSRFYA